MTVAPLNTIVRPAVCTLRTTACAGSCPRPSSSRKRLTINSP